MKLTKQKLYRLIKEAMDEKQYGSGFQNFLQIPIRTYMDEEDMLDVDFLETHIGEKLGSGYSRMVFKIDDNHVAKIAYRNPESLDQNAFTEGCQSNLMEYLKFNKYPHAFPKSYGIFKEDSVLVVEKVTVVSKQDQMDRVLRNAFPSLIEGAQYLIQQGYTRVDPSWVFERILDTWDEVIGDPSPIRRDEFPRAMNKHRTQGMSAQQLEALWNIVTKDTKLMNWVSTLRELNVEFDEIWVGNVGTNAEENKLILIDISNFDFGSGTEIEQKIPRGVQHSKMSNVPYDHRRKNIETDPDYEKVGPGHWRKK